MLLVRTIIVESVADGVPVDACWEHDAVEWMLDARHRRRYRSTPWTTDPKPA
jgi:hypothetical protein